MKKAREKIQYDFRKCSKKSRLDNVIEVYIYITWGGAKVYL